MHYFKRWLFYLLLFKNNNNITLNIPINAIIAFILIQFEYYSESVINTNN